MLFLRRGLFAFGLLGSSIHRCLRLFSGRFLAPAAFLWSSPELQLEEVLADSDSVLLLNKELCDCAGLWGVDGDVDLKKH